VTAQGAGYNVAGSESRFQALASAPVTLPAASLPLHALLHETSRDSVDTAGAVHDLRESQTMSFREIQRLLPTARKILAAGD